jgi:glycine/sarcosine N-methyltransferase
VAGNPGGKGLGWQKKRGESMDRYKELAEHYEAVNSREEIFQQKDFYQKLIQENGIQSALDCACGLGWHLDMLDELGVSCVGSDLSPEMVRLAQDNLSDRSIEIKEGDYQNLNEIWQQKFDLIICVTSAINHMQDDGAIIQALKSMKSRLKENGILVIATGVSDALLHGRPKFIPAKETEELGLYFFLEYFSENKVDFNILQVRKGTKGFEHSFAPMPLNIIGKEKMVQCCQSAGLTNIRVYGDFDFNEYHEKNLNHRLTMVIRNS